MTTPKQRERAKTLTDAAIVYIRTDSRASITRGILECWLGCSSIESSRVVTELQKRNVLGRAERPFEMHDSANRENLYSVKRENLR